jgi:hypothetical protein
VIGENPVIQAHTHFGVDFDEVIAWYMLNGYIYSGDDLFVLACKHNKDAVIRDREIKELDKLDCWYIQYASGDLKRLFELVPEEKEWVVFERWGKNNKKAFKFDKIKLRICHGST